MKSEININGLRLLPEKAAFLDAEKMLIIADLHFGKINHFRQAGMPVPAAANRHNEETLIDLINLTRPARVVFLGDLFHSHYNDEWEILGQIMTHFAAVSFELVRGNHDIMSETQYIRKGLKVADAIDAGVYLLTHEPMAHEDIPDGRINMAGHLHPGARLEGRGRQGIVLPCFWLSPNQLILPAFGSFTGLATIRPGAQDRVWIIVERQIMEVTLEAPKKQTRLSR
ncbi:MAG: ligase-associated DNA damage response endonuclease PdeM [Cyclobacteriaceae bacterium]|nr:ligase-associated DNA damage response endonuclease PdeM [Cyclobacteriaceae bacterium]